MGWKMGEPDALYARFVFIAVLSYFRITVLFSGFGGRRAADGEGKTRTIGDPFGLGFCSNAVFVLASRTVRQVHVVKRATKKRAQGPRPPVRGRTCACVSVVVSRVGGSDTHGRCPCTQPHPLTRRPHPGGARAARLPHGAQPVVERSHG